MLPLLAVCLLTGAAPNAELSPGLGLTVDLVNPDTAGGHRLLSLEDVIGEGRRTDIPRLPSAEALLVFSVTPSGCGATGLCAEVAKRTAEARERGAMVLGVILASKEEAAAATTKVRAARHPFPLTFDVHGLVRKAFAFEGPTILSVIDAKGVNILKARPSKAGDPAQVARALEQARDALLVALGRDEEDE